MRNFKEYIDEWKLTDDSVKNIDKTPAFTVKPEYRWDLEDIIVERLKDNVECPYLLDIDVSNIDDFHSLFSADRIYYLWDHGIDGTKIKKVNLSTWNTSKATTFFGMFYECSGLEQVNLSSFNTSRVNEFKSMFYGCSSIKYIDITSFDIRNGEYFGHMFNGCKSLEKIKGIDKIGINGIPLKYSANTLSMFDFCKESIIPDWYRKRKN